MTSLQTAKPVKYDVVLPPSADGSSFAIYKAASAAQVEVTLPAGARAEDFFIDAANYQLPHAVATRVRMHPQNIRRGAAEIAQDAAPTIQIYLHVAGTVDAVCEKRRMQFGPGDSVIYDSRRGYECVVGDVEARIVMLSRDRAPPLLLSPGVHGFKLDGGDAGPRLLATAIESLLREIDGLTLIEADHAVTAIFQLAAGLVEARLADDEHPHVAPTLEAALAFIGHRLADPNLSMQDVRAHLGISRSGLYRMFAPFGGIDAAIRQRRLDAALRAMLSRPSPRLGLEQLGKRHGYRKGANFARAFEARFGVAPGELHTKLLTRDEPWLKAQAKRAGFASLEAWIAARGADGDTSRPDGRRLAHRARP